jgi:hypothetical protein
VCIITRVPFPVSAVTSACGLVGCADEGSLSRYRQLAETMHTNSPADILTALWTGCSMLVQSQKVKRGTGKTSIALRSQIGFQVWMI